MIVCERMKEKISMLTMQVNYSLHYSGTSSLSLHVLSVAMQAFIMTCMFNLTNFITKLNKLFVIINDN